MTQTLTSIDEKALQQLGTEELVARLMDLPAKQRLDAILSRTDSAALVAAFPEQDFYLSVMELGPDNSLQLLALAQVPQLMLVSDLQWWHKDQILPGKALEWLERLSRASEQNLLKWFYEADFVLLVSLFKKWLRVEVIPEDADLLEIRDEFPPHTLDDQYFWESSYPQYEDLLRRILGFLFETNYGFYKELMNHIVWVGDPEMEEEAFRFRRARLEDLAIPDFYDALEIYRAIRSEDILTQNKITLAQGRPSGESPPCFALALLSGGNLLDRSLSRLKDSPWRATLQLELAALANKVVVADEHVPEESESLRQAVDKVAAMVNLGLDLRAAGSEDSAVLTLEQVFLEHLFRLGHTRVASLRGSLQRLCRSGWLAEWPTGIACLDDPWKEAVELLMAKTPMVLRPGGEPQHAPRTDLIRNRQDLFLAGQTVATISALNRLSEGLRTDVESLASSLWQGGQARQSADVTLGRLLWTAAANQLWRGRWQIQLLTVGLWNDAYPHLAPKSVEETIGIWLKEQIPDDTQRSPVLVYLQPLLRAYREEIAVVGPEGIPDPRYVTFFLFSDD
jgi:hypothetical protein